MIYKPKDLFSGLFFSEFGEVIDVGNELQSNSIHGAKREFMIAKQSIHGEANS